MEGEILYHMVSPLLLFIAIVTATNNSSAGRTSGRGRTTTTGDSATSKY